jgi:hypothetical protein
MSFITKNAQPKNKVSFDDEVIESPSDLTDLTIINGVGTTTAKRLNKAGLNNVQDVATVDVQKLVEIGITSSVAKNIINGAKAMVTGIIRLKPEGDDEGDDEEDEIIPEINTAPVYVKKTEEDESVDTSEWGYITFRGLRYKTPHRKMKIDGVITELTKKDYLNAAASDFFTDDGEIDIVEWMRLGDDARNRYIRLSSAAIFADPQDLPELFIAEDYDLEKNPIRAPEFLRKRQEAEKELTQDFQRNKVNQLETTQAFIKNIAHGENDPMRNPGGFKKIDSDEQNYPTNLNQTIEPEVRTDDDYSSTESGRRVLPRHKQREEQQRSIREVIRQATDPNQTYEPKKGSRPPNA